MPSVDPFNERTIHVTIFIFGAIFVLSILFYLYSDQIAAASDLTTPREVFWLKLIVAYILSAWGILAILGPWDGSILACLVGISLLPLTVSVWYDHWNRRQ